MMNIKCKMVKCKAPIYEKREIKSKFGLTLKDEKESNYKVINIFLES